jgi:hypothetical protein
MKMKKLIKKGFILAAYLVLPLSLIASDIANLKADAFIEKKPSELDTALLTRQAIIPTVATRRNNLARSLLITGESFDHIRESGAFHRQFLIPKLRIPAIGLPSDFEFPTATIGFRIPSDYNKRLESVLKVQFVTTTSELIFSGNVAVVLNADIASPNGTLIGGTPNIPPRTLGFEIINVQSAPASAAANYYVAKVKTTGEFEPGDFVYLTVSRDNAVLNNFLPDIFVVGLELDYNNRRR